MGNSPSLHQTPPSLQSAVVRVDTLNDLPDEILTHILSFLPYKDAFRTRILSKRWLPLCHSLSVLNIDDEGVNSQKDWIHFPAKQRRVEYLNLLNIPLAPTTIFFCKTLVVLRLMSIRVANMFRCSIDVPLLKTLDLFNVGFDDMENLMRLISGCPVLENLKTSLLKRVPVLQREESNP
ncbi:F-box/LRR-repeat protein [Trifolium medium]|uniref:F-box/LRR-repeat protein n=1 Tax=Trifolium medium TaxID=97028 RepID=A0A392NIC0_9FABA|nr:F-box/LRR-repeat protein [Trifolium medium]